LWFGSKALTVFLLPCISLLQGIRDNAITNICLIIVHRGSCFFTPGLVMTIPTDIGLGNRHASLANIPDLEYIRAVIRSYRLIHGETMVSLATRSGVSRAVIESIESGEKSPTIGVLARLALAMHIRPGDLLHPPQADSMADIADGMGACDMVSCQQLPSFSENNGLELYRFAFTRYGSIEFSANPGVCRKHIWLDEGFVTLHLPTRVQEIGPEKLTTFNAGFPHRLECRRGSLARGMISITCT
jgi:XRE family transcriptional regulator, regulator of sulfur utilization